LAVVKIPMSEPRHAWQVRTLSRPRRDADLLITSELLYQLSYIGIKRARIKPKLSFAVKVIAWRHHIFPSIGKIQAENSNPWKLGVVPLSKNS